ncbi:FadR/GntR family transcriptional regulator [Streptomyces sp. NPDC053499]|uniref:FadR/GntR family transcriptional regulator n=1 Tax=Streptomyces sp. NPDC053499 TaxID=3365707 RepID=UPI0037D23D65
MAVTDEAIGKIKEMIVTGALGPGDRLPKESELATELGLSRNSLREAVRALALIRVLDVRQGDGTYVTSLDPQIMVEAMRFVLDFQRGDTDGELWTVRRILEPTATALAGTRIAVAELDALESRLDALELRLEPPAPELSAEELVAADLEFHHRIATASGNSALCALLDGLAEATTPDLSRQGPGPADAAGRTLHEHRQILSALRAGDTEAARAWATVHLVGVEAALRQVPGSRSGVSGGCGASVGTP